MTITEIEDYYRTMADNYYRKAEDLRHRGKEAEEIKDFDRAVTLYTLCTENFEKSTLCTDFVNALVKHDILEAIK